MNIFYFKSRVLISLAITNKLFLSCLFVSTYQREMQVYTFKSGKNRLERSLEKNCSSLLYFDHPVYRNFHKTFQLLFLTQTALILVNFFAVFSWFLLLLSLLLLFSILFIIFLSIFDRCLALNALMLIYCMCENAR